MEKELIKNLEILTQMMREYAERNQIIDELQLRIKDGRGCIYLYNNDIQLFSFYSLPELIEKLKK